MDFKECYQRKAGKSNLLQRILILVVQVKESGAKLSQELPHKPPHMPYYARDVLARKFRQNWLNKFSDIRYSSFIDKEIDDSLTNLNWLPNMNLTKLASQPMPLSPITASSLKSGKYLELRHTVMQETGLSGDITCTWDQIDENTKQFYKNHAAGRPPFSHVSLICMAIQDIGQSRITAGQICEWIIGNFPYYQLIDSLWQNSVRNLLSISKCFQKVPRRKDEPEKGGFWRLSGDYQKYLNQPPNTPSYQSCSTSSGKSNYSQSSLYSDCYGSNHQYASSFSQLSNSDSGHGSHLSTSSRKQNSRSVNCNGHSNYNYNNRNPHQNQNSNQLKRSKSKYHNSVLPFNMHSSYSQFQQHITSNFLQDCNNSDNRICSSKNFYMNPAAISTPIGKGNSSYPSHFPHYPYFPTNGRSRNRHLVDNERYYNNSRQGIHRFGTCNRQNSSLSSKAFTDSSYDNRLSSLQHSNNSAFSSFRNLVHKRSYQFSVQSPDCGQFPHLTKNLSLMDNLDYRNYKNSDSTNNEDLNKSLKFIDPPDFPLSFSSSDQFLINPDLVKNELSFNGSPAIESAELSELHHIQIKEELKSSSNGWWNDSHFDRCSMDTLPSCEKSEPLVLSPFSGLLDKDQQWVDEELNLEELDSILGLS